MKYDVSLAKQYVKKSLDTVFQNLKFDYEIGSNSLKVTASLRLNGMTMVLE